MDPMNAQEWLEAKPMRDRWFDELQSANEDLAPLEAAARVHWIRNHIDRGTELILGMEELVSQLRRARLRGREPGRKGREKVEASPEEIDVKMRTEIWDMRKKLDELFGNDDRPPPFIPQKPDEPEDDGGGSELKGSRVPNPGGPPAMHASAAKERPHDS